MNENVVKLAKNWLKHLAPIFWLLDEVYFEVLDLILVRLHLLDTFTFFSSTNRCKLHSCHHPNVSLVSAEGYSRLFDLDCTF